MTWKLSVHDSVFSVHVVFLQVVSFKRSFMDFFSQQERQIHTSTVMFTVTIHRIHRQM